MTEQIEDPKPVTVGELLLALATYPQDAEVITGENGDGGGTLFADGPTGFQVIWAGNTYERPERYAPPEPEAIERAAPGDEFAIVQDFLRWANGAYAIGTENPAAIAREFATRGKAAR